MVAELQSAKAEPGSITTRAHLRPEMTQLISTPARELIAQAMVDRRSGLDPPTPPSVSGQQSGKFALGACCAERGINCGRYRRLFWHPKTAKRVFSGSSVSVWLFVSRCSGSLRWTLPTKDKTHANRRQADVVLLVRRKPAAHGVLGPVGLGRPAAV